MVRFGRVGEIFVVELGESYGGEGGGDGEEDFGLW